MNTWLLMPPAAFAVLLLIAWLKYLGMALLRRGESWSDRPGKSKPYACGEDLGSHRVQPDYSQFFPFAFFFTIMHVAALMTATVPGGSGACLFAALYLIGAVTGLFILFRR